MKHGIKAKDIRDFEKCTTKLQETMQRIRSYAPEAHIYVACDTMNLMSQSGENKEEEQSYVVSETRIDGMDCGDW